VYKAVGNDDLQEVWHWNNDHGGFRSLVSTVYDINNDGYNELITAGNAKISIFEVDAVDLLSPNGGSYGVGDTIPVRWAINTPPRCDSLSLFLRRDSLWNLDTIATGLLGADTLYRWVVPESVPDTGRIIVMAYGTVPGRDSVPGHVAWQWDMSDSVITFIGGGVAEGIHFPSASTMRVAGWSDHFEKVLSHRAGTRPVYPRACFRPASTSFVSTRRDSGR
jgi:hypothetical protein